MSAEDSSLNNNNNKEKIMISAMKKIKKIISVSILTVSIFSITGCEFMNSKVQSMKGSISGNEYIASFYSNDGEKFMTMHGERIDLSPNTVKEYDYVDGGYNKVLSSVVTITIDGKEVENCGSTAIFAEEGLKPDVDFTMDNIKNINSSSDGSVSAERRHEPSVHTDAGARGDGFELLFAELGKIDHYLDIRNARSVIERV